jgi:hypothetical protein
MDLVRENELIILSSGQQAKKDKRVHPGRKKPVVISGISDRATGSINGIWQAGDGFAAIAIHQTVL